MSVFEIIIQFKPALLRGLGVTMQLCLLIWSIGLSLGVLIGVASSRWKRSVGIVARILSFTLSGIPVLVLLFWFHYPMQNMLDLVIKPFYTAVAALTIVNTFGTADLVRNVLNDFPEQYIAAAKMCGLSKSEILLEIQAPIVGRQALPGLLILQVNMLQASLFASLISVDEIFRVAQQINAQVYRPVEIYTTLALLFLGICLPLNGVALVLKQRFTRNLSER